MPRSVPVMRILRRRDAAGVPRYGVLDDEGVVVHDFDGDPYAGGRRGRPVQPVDEVDLVAPATPSKIVCVGHNHASTYAALGREPGEEPLFFLKSPNTVAGPFESVSCPEGAAALDVAGELAVVVGTRARRLTEPEALDHVLGYTCALDVAVREWMAPGTQWFRAKSSDGFCPLGPWIVRDVAPDRLRIRVSVNGRTMQDGSTAELVWSVPRLLVEITRYVTLEPGDVVLTGSPAGLAVARPGDTVAVSIDGIGTLVNTVTDTVTSTAADPLTDPLARKAVS